MILAIFVSIAAWFVVAAILFFNPIADRFYRSQESEPAVRALQNLHLPFSKSSSPFLYNVSYGSGI